MQAKVRIARFPYRSMEHPSLMTWMVDTVLKCKADSRISSIDYRCYDDTPITMTRNLALEEAQADGIDFLLMVDNDNQPDVEPDGKPFWDTSFDFMFRRETPCIVAAPYCGRPPVENVFVFRLANWNNDSADHWRLEAYTREEAAIRGGMEEVAAIPTGLCLIDMRILKRLPKPWFDYEMNKSRSKKESTEDVFFSRNIWLAKAGEVFVNWDAWAGHWKYKCVTKPRLTRKESILESMREAIASDRPGPGEKLVMFGEGKPDPKPRFHRNGQFSVASETKQAKSETKKTEPDVMVGKPLPPLLHPTSFKLRTRGGSQDYMTIVECIEENQYRLPDRFEEDDVIIDLGANIGAFAAAVLDRGGKVVCFEPDEDNFNQLLDNLDRLEWRFRHKEYQKAAWITTGKVRFTNRGGIFTACHYVGESVLDTDKTTTVDCLDINSIIDAHPEVRLLKMDVEGSEGHLLEHLDIEIAQRIQEIVGEIHAKAVNPRLITARLKELGFSVEVVPSERFGCEELLNFYAKRPEKTVCALHIHDQANLTETHV